MGKKKAYAVVRGRNVGVFEDWIETKLLVDGVSGCLFTGYSTKEEAERKFFQQLEAGNVLILRADGQRESVDPSTYPRPNSIPSPSPPGQIGRSHSPHVEQRSSSESQPALMNTHNFPMATSSTAVNSARPDGVLLDSYSQYQLPDQNAVPSQGKITRALTGPLATVNSPRFRVRVCESGEASTTQHNRQLFQSASFSTSSSPPTEVTQMEPLSPSGLSIKLEAVSASPCSGSVPRRTTARSAPQSPTSHLLSSFPHSKSHPSLSNSPSTLGLTFEPYGLPASQAVDPRSPSTGASRLIPFSPSFPRASPSLRSGGGFSSSFQGMVIR